MLKFAVKFIRSLLVLFGRVFLILTGLVFSSSVNAASTFLSSGSTSENLSTDESDWNTVNDLGSAQNAYANGSINESTMAHYWATEKDRK